MRMSMSMGSRFCGVLAWTGVEFVQDLTCMTYDYSKRNLVCGTEVHYMRM